jgi:hypothetical protein
MSAPQTTGARRGSRGRAGPAPEDGVIARSATEALVDAVRPLRDLGAVLVPALYCSEVTREMEAVGCVLRCYDVAGDLSRPRPRIGADVAGVLWHHPFGWYHPVPEVPPGVTVIEDGCFSLRSLLELDRAHGAGPLVTSLRKEFGWRDGAWVRSASRLGGPPGDVLRSHWEEIGWAGTMATGRAATAAAFAALGPLLPARGDGAPIVTMLPLRSLDRDRVVDELRAAGVEAWYWRQPIPGCSAAAFPQASELGKQLFLVRTPAPGSRVYAQLADCPLETWPR